MMLTAQTQTITDEPNLSGENSSGSFARTTFSKERDQLG